MKKVLVIGCPGSGKSTFSKQLQQLTNLPLYHLDRMYWNADKTTVSKEVFQQRLMDVLCKEEWIIDGNYASTMKKRMQKCDTIFFLDYPLEVCLDGIRMRRGKPRTDMPWIETEEDEEFNAFIKSFNDQNRPEIIELLKVHRDKQIVVFHTRKDADDFLEQLAFMKA